MAIDLSRTLPEIVRRAIDSALADVHVAVPGQVVAYDATKGLADVAVMVQHTVWDDDNNRSYEDAGTLPGVPVEWPRAGGFVMTFPLAVGDTGMLIFNSDAIGEWRTSNQKSQPADAMRLNIGWPVFRPGLSADVNPLAAGDVSQRTAGLVLGKDGGAQQILIPTAGTTIDIGKGATDFVALAAAVLTQLTNLKTAISGAACTAGDGGLAFKTAILASLTSNSWPASVAATIARAK